MFDLRILINTTIVLTIMFVVVACNNSELNQDKSDYDELCRIYEEVLDESIAPEMIGAELTKRIQNEIPGVYVHFKNIANADPKDAYQLFKKVAEKETEKAWDCKVMKDFYSDK